VEPFHDVVHPDSRQVDRWIFQRGVRTGGNATKEGTSVEGKADWLQAAGDDEGPNLRFAESEGRRRERGPAKEPVKVGVGTRIHAIGRVEIAGMWGGGA
jgi:hypothetical protein